MGSKHPFSETLFAKLFQTAVGKDYLISFQWNTRSKSKFTPLNRGLKNIFLLVLGAVTLGLLFCCGELGYWAYQKISLRLHHEHNAHLKRNLDDILQTQAGLELTLDSLTAFKSRLRALYGMNIPNDNLRQFGIGGRRTAAEVSLEGNPIYEKVALLSTKHRQIMNRTDYTRKSIVEIKDHVHYKHQLWEHTPSVMPAKGRITSGFGSRNHPITGRNARHEGLDIANTRWTPIYASANGIVKSAGPRGHYGQLVELDHGNGYLTKYAHMSKTIVEKGRRVKRYELLGYMGSTGRSTGDHLHYEVHRDGIPRNPTKFILPSGILVD